MAERERRHTPGARGPAGLPGRSRSRVSKGLRGPGSRRLRQSARFPRRPPGAEVFAGGQRRDALLPLRARSRAPGGAGRRAHALAPEFTALWFPGLPALPEGAGG